MNRSHAFETLAAKRAEAQLGGGQARIDAQHAKKKLTARERLELLFDEGSFEELGALVTHRSTLFGLDQQQFLGDGVVTGYGSVNGRLTYAYAQDFTVLGGRSPRRTPRKFAASWTWRWPTAHPLLASTTRAEPASRKG